MALQHLRSGTAHKRPIPTVMSAGQIAINTNEASPGLFFKDSNGDLVKVGPVHIGTTAPNSSPDSVAATALVTGTVYQILTVGTSDFTLVGASANTVGTIFTATGTTTGTGTVSGQQGVEKGEQWLDTTGGNYVLKIYDGTAWRSEAGEFVNVSGDTMTGALLLDNAASASAPDLSFDGDANTGIYSPGADQFGVATGGTAALTIDSSQNVGIGTTSPSAELHVATSVNNGGLVLHKTSIAGSTGAKLSYQLTNTGSSAVEIASIKSDQVNATAGSETGNLLFSTTNSGSASERMRIDSSGKVGVGTSSPATLMHIAAASDPELRIEATGSAVSDDARLVFKTTNGEFLIQNDRSLGTSGVLTFNGNTVDNLCIDHATGKVGVGTTSPSSLNGDANNLVVGSGSGSEGLTIFSGNTSAGNIFFADSTSAQHQGVVQYDHNGDFMRFMTAGYNERMRIDSSGRLGVGTSNPAFAVDVSASNDTVVRVRTNGNTSAGFVGSTDDGANSWFFGSRKDAVGGSSGTDRFNLLYGTSAFLTVAAGGNVGVGTTGPGALFDARGSVRLGNQGNGDGTTGIVSTNGVYIGTNYGTTTSTVTALQIGGYPAAPSYSGTPDQAIVLDGWSGTTVYHNAIINRKGRDLSFHTAITGTSFSDTNERARIDSSGRLLLGTTSASSNTRLNQKFAIATSGSSYGGMSITQYPGTGVDSAPVLDLQRSRGTSDGTFTKVQSGDRLGVIVFRGSDGSTFNDGALIAGRADGEFSTSGDTTDSPGRLEFQTTPDGSYTPTTRITIHHTGELRMGTTEQAAISTDPVHTLGEVSIDTVQTNLARLIVQDRSNNWISFKGGSGVHNGTISVSGSGVNYGSNSDYRLKENVIDLTNAISRIKQLAPKRFNFIVEPEVTVDGFLAHEAQAVVPEAVTGTHNEIAIWEETDLLPEGVSAGDTKLDEDGNVIPVIQNMDHTKLVPLLTAALQEAIAKIETLEQRLTDAGL